MADEKEQPKEKKESGAKTPPKGSPPQSNSSSPAHTPPQSPTLHPRSPSLHAVVAAFHHYEGRRTRDSSGSESRPSAASSAASRPRGGSTPLEHTAGRERDSRGHEGKSFSSSSAPSSGAASPRSSGDLDEDFLDLDSVEMRKAGITSQRRLNEHDPDSDDEFPNAGPK